MSLPAKGLAQHEEVEDAQSDEGDVSQPGEPAGDVVVITEPFGDRCRPVEGPQAHHQSDPHADGDAAPGDDPVQPAVIARALGMGSWSAGRFRHTIAPHMEIRDT